jgi:hypothetical protein
MGFSISWAGVQTADRAAVLGVLGLVESGEPDEFFETAFSGAEFTGGWFVILSQNCDLFRRPDLLAALSGAGRVIAACAEEHVMFSSAEEWQGGARLWSAEHVGEHGKFDDLTTSGSPPPRLNEISAQMKKEQGSQTDVDMGFEVPLRTAQEIVGFKHDEHHPGGVTFMRLDKAGKGIGQGAGAKETKDKSAKGGLFGLFRK